MKLLQYLQQVEEVLREYKHRGSKGFGVHFCKSGESFPCKIIATESIESYFHRHIVTDEEVAHSQGCTPNALVEWDASDIPAQTMYAFSNGSSIGTIWKENSKS